MKIVPVADGVNVTTLVAVVVLRPIKFPDVTAVALVYASADALICVGAAEAEMPKLSATAAVA